VHGIKIEFDGFKLRFESANGKLIQFFEAEARLNII
jgi:hypothetical protein